MYFHTWDDQRFTSMENSRMNLLIYLHCFQNFGQFKILKFFTSRIQQRIPRVHSLASSVLSVQSPGSRVQHPTLASRVQEFRYAQEIQLFHHIRNCRVAIFLCTAFLEYTPVILNSLSFLTLKSFIEAY